MDERMPRRECNQSAGDAPDWKTGGSAERNGLSFAIVRVNNIELLVPQALAYRTDASEPHHF
jgi:hypothetical protein